MALFISAFFHFLLFFITVAALLRLSWVSYQAGLKYYSWATAVTGVTGNILLIAFQKDELIVGLSTAMIAIALGLALYARKLMKQYRIGPFAEGDASQEGEGAQVVSSDRDAHRTRVFMNVAVGAAFAAFGLMTAFGPMWGLLPAILFAVFASVY